MRFCCTFGWLAVTNPHAVPPASPPYLPTPTQDKESWELSDSEKIEHAKAKKEKGNVLYKQGKYQGKPDEKPWENNRWSDKTQWETALKTRSAGQNEYLRAE